jgi:hypothetical protein
MTTFQPVRRRTGGGRATAAAAGSRDHHRSAAGQQPRAHQRRRGPAHRRPEVAPRSAAPGIGDDRPTRRARAADHPRRCRGARTAVRRRRNPRRPRGGSRGRPSAVRRMAARVRPDPARRPADPQRPRRPDSRARRTVVKRAPESSCPAADEDPRDTSSVISPLSDFDTVIVRTDWAPVRSSSAGSPACFTACFLTIPRHACAVPALP